MALCSGSRVAARRGFHEAFSRVWDRAYPARLAQLVETGVAKSEVDVDTNVKAAHLWRAPRVRSLWSRFCGRAGRGPTLRGSRGTGKTKTTAEADAAG
jgi:hypothetical protein